MRVPVVEEISTVVDVDDDDDASPAAWSWLADAFRVDERAKLLLETACDRWAAARAVEGRVRAVKGEMEEESEFPPIVSEESAIDASFVFRTSSMMLSSLRTADDSLSLESSLPSTSSFPSPSPSSAFLFLLLSSLICCRRRSMAVV